MKIIRHVEQGSDAWKNLRAGKTTASRVKDARDKLKSGQPSQKQKAYAAQVAVERIAQQPVDEFFETWQMRQGKEQEGFAREWYEQETGHFVDEITAVMTDDEAYLYSPDGLLGEDGLLEIKCLFSADRIVDILAGADTSDFMDQCQFGLWLTGRKWIDLMLWAPKLVEAGIGARIIRIDRDEEYIEAMEQDLLAFAQTVDSKVELLMKLKETP